MFRTAVVLFFILLMHKVSAQNAVSPLSVEKIMLDPKWIGSSPSEPFWTADGKSLCFKWNPDGASEDSLYAVTPGNPVPRKLSLQEQRDIVNFESLVFNIDHTAYVYAKEGDIFFNEIKKNKRIQLTATEANEHNPAFAANGRWIVYTRDQNIYAYDIAYGETIQLTNFKKGTTPQKDSLSKKLNSQEAWLKKDQLRWMQVLRERKEKKEAEKKYEKLLRSHKELKPVYTGDKIVRDIQVSPGARFITYELITAAPGAKHTIIPDYVTESGFTEDIAGRTKVGAPAESSELYIYDREKDTILVVKTDSIPGIRDVPDFLKDYPKVYETKTKNPELRAVNIGSVSWSPQGIYTVVDIRARDNKDRWLMRLDATTGRLSLLDRQHDDAWIGGPGTGSWGSNSGWIDEQHFWFRSEVTGFSHLYSVDLVSGEKKALTSGEYEVQTCMLSPDKKYFYITTNAVDPGERQFYRLPVAGGKPERITTMTGANDVTVSPDGKTIAILYSYSNKPWELYLQENKPGGKLVQATNKAQSAAFKSYHWRDPELVYITARDGAKVRARLYKPVNAQAGAPAVIFVHGAGYLQNAHKWWSSYFREFMFHNLLADNGYYVLDMDYRGSAGYGRDWRTGIYRYMGGKDLTDNIDGAKWLVDQYRVDPKKIGIYGGSYGGFITLMALFTSPGTFAAGAALRPVTDWAHYNHGYTSNILNTPAEDSIAYRRSSPVYFAEGLQDHLLICHGVVDVNVHFQDVMLLNQRLIELGKNNWQVAMYPMEDHGFIEPSSWTDEYKRIFRLFEQVLKH